uniref:Uncharacterized protein n=1 Tax=Pristionchus pacificus TaxID=54126 RepID=A0A2A6CBV4_PRIPA|eukprot:PDM75705.1 hypothetical protein PRIPAC_40084 [Pristionchus pacificus]
MYVLDAAETEHDMWDRESEIESKVKERYQLWLSIGPTNIYDAVTENPSFLLNQSVIAAHVNDYEVISQALTALSGRAFYDYEDPNWNESPCSTGGVCREGAAVAAAVAAAAASVAVGLQGSSLSFTRPIPPFFNREKRSSRNSLCEKSVVDISAHNLPYLRSHPLLFLLLPSSLRDTLRTRSTIDRLPERSQWIEWMQASAQITARNMHRTHAPTSFIIHSRLTSLERLDLALLDDSALMVSSAPAKV